jgi:GDP-4-dehydro-6-deoxy-D-mannose reductase
MTGPVLVTGASGFAGSYLLDLLAPAGTEIVAIKRPNTPPPRVTWPDVRWVEMELLDQSAVTRALGEWRPSTVYHLAGAAHVAQSWQRIRETYEDNVLATQYLFAGLRVHGLTPRMLLTCSGHVYAPQPRPIREDDELNPASPYATSKLATEMVAQHAVLVDGLPVFIARSFNHIGPRQDPSYVSSSIARQIALIEAGGSEPVLRVGNLEPQRDLTDVRDTVRAYAAMVAHARPGTPYNVASGKGVAVGHLVQLLVSRAQREIRVTQNPELFRPNDPPFLVGDRAKLTADTGWEPTIALAQTVEDLLAYWRARVASES